MAPGYHHKGISRAGLLALDDGGYEHIEKNSLSKDNSSSYSDLTRKEKRVRTCQSLEETDNENCTNGISTCESLDDLEYSYDTDFLSMFLDNERDHYSSLWSSSNCIGQREFRDWLWKLWVGKPGLRDLIWKVYFFHSLILYYMSEASFLLTYSYETNIVLDFRLNSNP